MAGVCVPLSAPGCVMYGNFAPMRALLSALWRGQFWRGGGRSSSGGGRSRGGRDSLPPPNRTQESKVQQHLREIFPLYAAARNVSNHRSGSKAWDCHSGIKREARKPTPLPSLPPSPPEDRTFRSSRQQQWTASPPPTHCRGRWAITHGTGAFGTGTAAPCRPAWSASSGRFAFRDACEEQVQPGGWCGGLEGAAP